MAYLKDIPRTAVEEGHVKAVKSQDDFGGINMWHLHVKDAKGRWDDVQWMDVGNIQRFFNEKLPVYKEVKNKRKFEEI